MRNEYSHGIPLQKRYGQHFLRDQSVVEEMVQRVTLNAKTPVFEIGCGDGFLTQALLQTSLPLLWVFEIDPEWARYVQEKYADSRLTLFNEDILAVDFDRFAPFAPWTLLANLPYQITFPILKRLQEYRHFLREGVIMVQEEVAQKLVARAGDSTIQSLYYSYYFTWELLRKVPPTAFQPPPRVDSRLLYFVPRHDLQPIPCEQDFWKFVKLSFRQRRRTLKNNLMQTHYSSFVLPDRWRTARAQELSLDDFIELWIRLSQEYTC